jgi:hypothetical protein
MGGDWGVRLGFLPCPAFLLGVEDICTGRKWAAKWAALLDASGHRFPL